VVCGRVHGKEREVDLGQVGGQDPRVGALARHVAIELRDRARREIGAHFRIEGGCPAARQIFLDNAVQAGVADHHDVGVAFGHHARSCNGVGVAVDDHLDGLLAHAADRLQHELAVVPGVARVEGDQAVLGLDDAHGSEPVAAEDPDALRGILDRRLEPVEVTHAIEKLLVRDRTVGSLHQLDGSAHVRRQRSVGFRRGRGLGCGYGQGE